MQDEILNKAPEQNSPELQQAKPPEAPTIPGVMSRPQKTKRKKPKPQTTEQI